MILGIGTDIVEISRIEQVLERQGRRFAERVLTATELAVFEQHKSAKAFLAKRFAAKEAASKALGTGIAQGVSFHDFIIQNDEHGAPLLQFQGKALQIAQNKGVSSYHLSLSDERDYAVAYVVLES